MDVDTKPSEETQPPDDVVLPTGSDGVSKDKPRLTISRHPTFVPIPDTGVPPLCVTETLCMNRALNQIGFRYCPAGLAEPGSAIAYRTIESRPTSVRVSWEDRSPFIRVTEDGLELGGEGGFRSARCNVPVREGKWYMEVNIIKGGGEGTGQNASRDGAHIRLGWGRREAPLNGPIGLDGYSYGFRDKTGDKVTLSRPKPYGKPFKAGDVVGLYISLPPRRNPDPNDPYDPAQMKRERIAIEFKGQEYWESLECQQTKEMMALMQIKSKRPDSNNNNSNNNIPPETLSRNSTSSKNTPSGRAPKAKPQGPILRPLPTLGPESVIAFFINGECQGAAFQDLYDYLQLRQIPKEKEKAKRRETGLRQHVENPFDDGTLGYYPYFSLYNDARIRLNSGPDFRFPPPNDIDAVLSSSNFHAMDVDLDSKLPNWRPLCHRYAEFMKEVWDQDDADEAIAKVLLDQAAEREREEVAKLALKEKKRQDALAKKAAKRAAAMGIDPSIDTKPSLLSGQKTSMVDRFGPEINAFFLESSASSPAPSVEEYGLKSLREDDMLQESASVASIYEAEYTKSSNSTGIGLTPISLGVEEEEGESEGYEGEEIASNQLGEPEESLGDLEELLDQSYDDDTVSYDQNQSHEASDEDQADDEFEQLLPRSPPAHNLPYQ